MAPPIRIAILEADVPLHQTSAEYGSYGGVFRSWLRKGADAAGVPWNHLEISGWNVVDLGNGQEEGVVEERGGRYNWTRTRGYPKLEDVDAILITGSRMCVISPIIRLVAVFTVWESLQLLADSWRSL